MIDPAGKVMDQYNKIKLVPFGEFVPDVFSWVNRISKEAGDFAQAGDRIVMFQRGLGARRGFHLLRVGVPRTCGSRVFPRRRRKVFVNISNDGYFGTSAAHEQHLELVRMRAAENARWIVRATNDGITATVDPAGRVTERLQPFTGSFRRRNALRDIEGSDAVHSARGLVRVRCCLGIGIAGCYSRTSAETPLVGREFQYWLHRRRWPYANTSL